MIHGVAATFFSTFITNLRAKFANLNGELATPGHVRNRQSADRRAVHIQFDTTRHGGDILFVETGAGAMVAGVGTLVAGADAGFVLVMSHGNLLAQHAELHETQT